MHQLISSRKTGFSHGTGGTFVRKELVLSKQEKLELERRRDLSTYGTKSKNKKNKKLAAQRYITPEPVRPSKEDQVDIGVGQLVVVDVEDSAERSAERNSPDAILDNISTKNQTQLMNDEMEVKKSNTSKSNLRKQSLPFTGLGKDSKLDSTYRTSNKLPNASTDQDEEGIPLDLRQKIMSQLENINNKKVKLHRTSSSFRDQATRNRALQKAASTIQYQTGRPNLKYQEYDFKSMSCFYTMNNFQKNPR